MYLEDKKLLEEEIINWIKYCSFVTLSSSPYINNIKLKNGEQIKISGEKYKPTA